MIFLFLGFLGSVLVHLCMDALLHPVRDAMDAGALRVREAIASSPLATGPQMSHKILQIKTPQTIRILIYPPTPPELQGPWPIFLGLRRIRVPFHGGFADVIANFPVLLPVFQELIGLIVAVIFSIIGMSWLFATMLTRETLRPLLLVTQELRRFASGDFTPGTVTHLNQDEFGELTSAYNAAAEQVASAFEEQIRVEEQMKRFVADASHELRTPLTVITGYIDIIKRMDVHDAAGHERAFRTLHVETRRIRLLVDRLVALARLERNDVAHREVLQLGNVINDLVLEIMAAHSESHITLNIEEETSIIADLADVYDAVRNLIENAVKYGENSPVCVTIFQRDGTAYVRIADAGPGIPAHEREHIFERFFRGEGRANIAGSGLGLSIVARAMQRSQGTVVLESAERGDTRFLLSFRLA